MEDLIKENLILILLIWFILGIHSAWFLVKRYTQYHDFTIQEIPMLIACVFIPLLTHMATFFVYPSKKQYSIKWKVLFNKRA